MPMIGRSSSWRTRRRTSPAASKSVTLNLVPVINEVIAAINESTPAVFGREIDLPTIDPSQPAERGHPPAVLRARGRAARGLRPGDRVRRRQAVHGAGHLPVGRARGGAPPRARAAPADRRAPPLPATAADRPAVRDRRGDHDGPAAPARLRARRHGARPGPDPGPASGGPEHLRPAHAQPAPRDRLDVGDRPPRCTRPRAHRAVRMGAAHTGAGRRGRARGLGSRRAPRRRRRPGLARRRGHHLGRGASRRPAGRRRGPRRTRPPRGRPDLGRAPRHRSCSCSCSSSSSSGGEPAATRTTRARRRRPTSRPRTLA